MNYSLHAVKVIMKRRILETLITPGLYIATVIGLGLGHLLVAGFTVCIDTSGLNFELNFVYSQIAKLLSGLFGNSFVERLFAQGPFRFAFLIALLPVFLYLPLSSVYKSGFEKSVGALELLIYGPSNGISFFLAFLLKDLLFLTSYSLLLILFFSVSASLNNFGLGRDFFYPAGTVFFLALGVYSYGILSSTITENAASATALFFGSILLFCLVQIGSFAVTGEYVKNLSSTVSWIIQWFSPVFYWSIGLQAVEYGNLFMQILSVCMLIILSGALLLLSHVAISVRGVKA